jgi:hypothetical protein
MWEELARTKSPFYPKRFPQRLFGEAALGSDCIDALLSEHMRGEAPRSEYIREGRVPHIQPACVSAEGRHHESYSITRETASAHDAPTRSDARYRVQMSGDFSVRGFGRRNVPERELAKGE